MLYIQYLPIRHKICYMFHEILPDISYTNEKNWLFDFHMYARYDLSIILFKKIQREQFIVNFITYTADDCWWMIDIELSRSQYFHVCNFQRNIEAFCCAYNFIGVIWSNFEILSIECRSKCKEMLNHHLYCMCSSVLFWIQMENIVKSQVYNIKPINVILC